VNYEKAFEWYEKAAEQGRAEAQYNLGVMYYHGQAVDQDDSMAMRWYAKAAAQGDVDAQARIDGIVEKRRASASALDAAMRRAQGKIK
jgi:TPR repeat protein